MVPPAPSLGKMLHTHPAVFKVPHVTEQQCYCEVTGGRGQGDHLSPTPVSRETDELLQEASLLSSYGKFENCLMLVCIIRF